MTPPAGPTPDLPLAERLLTLVGGADNVEALTHCWARLRFVLRDPVAAHDGAVGALEEVAIVVRQSGQFTVALRAGLLDTYAALRTLLDTRA